MPTFDDVGLVPVFGRGARQWVSAMGIFAISLGILLVVWQDKSAVLVGVLFGLYLLGSAVLLCTLAVAVRLSQLPKVLLFGAAVVSVILAALCFRSGNWVLLPAMWIGLAWAVRGVAHAIAAVWEDEKVTGGRRQEAFGLLTLVVGLVVAIAPFDSVTVLAVLAGVCMVAFGGMEVLTALRAPLIEDEQERVETSPADQDKAASLFG